MKVLFAVNNEKISQTIVKKYQEKYKEIISAKNVYYFNAIIKELQRDRKYDRIVISEDLEPFSNKNYDMIDKFLFEKMDSISDEASNGAEGEIPIILICTDRREKGENVLVKMFSIGIYSALIGNDRTIDNVCKMINTPRTKKEAKVYYKITTESADYSSERAEDVSETEIQNILNHYKRLGKNEDKYVESFNSIASQYTEGQLRVIVPFLPLNVRAVLEEKCEKYQKLMLGSVKGQIKKNKEKSVLTKNIKTSKKEGKEKGPKIDLIEEQLDKPRMSNPVVIPSAVDVSKVKRMYQEPQEVEEPNFLGEEELNELDDILSEVPGIEDSPAVEKSDIEESIDGMFDGIEEETQQVAKRRRGRPAKVKTEEEIEKPKRGRGRPPKQKLEQNDLLEEDNINLFDLAEEPKLEEQEEPDNIVQENNTQIKEDDEDDLFLNTDNMLPGLQEDDLLSDIQENNETEKLQSDPILPEIQENDDLLGLEDDSNMLPGLDDELFETQDAPQKGIFSKEKETAIRDVNQNNEQFADFSNLITGNNKIVAFVGTSKNGTSFLVNNLATMLAAKGINTAILDLTKNKNAYYIFTQNDENLRNQAYNCVNELRIGNPSGIKVSKNLTVYTTLPNEDEGLNDVGKVLETLSKNYSLVLMDCDFNTNYSYFDACNEIYLVQTYDILTIQPLTAFLKELLDRNILKEEKLRVVINKELKVKSLNEKMIIGGISSYNDPSMSLMKKLFNKDTMKYVTIPFEIPTYSKYLEGLVTCEISLNGYSAGLLNALSKLGDMVYPLISGKGSRDKKGIYNNYNSGNKSTFNSSIDSTLDKMRRNY